jgi:hypothetical protein
LVLFFLTLFYINQISDHKKYKMSICRKKIEENIETVIKYSGFHFMGFGEYHDCLELSPNFNYNYLRIATTSSNEMPSKIYKVMGLCLPSKCSKSLIKS